MLLNSCAGKKMRFFVKGRNINSTKIIKPYRFKLLNCKANLGGKKYSRIWDPSSGGIGSKLKTHSIELIQIPY